jgi:arabinan endo-1,5-alpha-L-arabinosidase
MHKKYTTCFKTTALVLATVLLVSATACNKATDIKENSSSTQVEENSDKADSKKDSSDTKESNDSAKSTDTKTSEMKLKKSTYSSLAAVHDPSIIKDGDTYYIFGSHMEAAKSSDLWTWDSFTTGVNSNNKLFNGLFESAAFDWVGLNDQGGYSVWAPDVIYNEKMGKYCMYFCTTSDWNTSTLCLATSDKIEGPYEYQASLIDSGFIAENVSKTNVVDVLGYDGSDRGYWTSTDYNSNDWPNALDPSVFYDEDGRLWMVYGSWSGGIFILELDEDTGLVIHPEDDKENGVDKYFGKHLLAQGHKSCEAPYILYDKTSGYYYLYVSYGSLNREGGYNIRMYRSENPDGPYVDAKGNTWLDSTMNHSSFGVKVMGNYLLPSLSKAYMAPGHNSAMIDDDGRMFLVYHTRFDNGTENHQPRVHQMFVNEDGWPVVAPFAFNEFTGGEERIAETGYSKDEIVGEYNFLSHMSDTSATIHDTEVINLNEDGTISGAVTGTWEQKKGSYYATIVMNDIEYKGVFFRQKDEAYQDVMTFTCLSNTNISIWGVKYIQE